MPTYDYACDACDHRFEQFQSIKDEALKKCPACKKQKLRRLIGPGAAIVFKGSGFYQTDYRSESYKKAAAADSKAGGDAGGGSSGGGESKGGEGKASESKTKSETKPAKSESKKSGGKDKS